MNAPETLENPFVLAYGCTSAAGHTVEALWEAVQSRKDLSRLISTENWPVPAKFSPRACKGLGTETLLEKMHLSWSQAYETLPAETKGRILKGSSLGVILASTKGPIDDVIWEENFSLKSDLLGTFLSDFLEKANLNPVRKTVLSNACASSLSAFSLASLWINSGAVEDVLVIAGDEIGPFTLQGFHCLRALTPGKAEPFSKTRSGLQLGDATAAILFSRHPGMFQLTGVGVDAEGFAVTRPSDSGNSLKTACLKIPNLREEIPDLIIAHGTATALNDQIESMVFYELFGENTPPITASKGTIGHSLGASGAIDFILALEALRRQKSFPIANTSEIDPTFKGNFLVGPEVNTEFSIRSVLVTSLGFGGIHAAARVEFSKDQNALLKMEKVFENPEIKLTSFLVSHPVTEPPEWSKEAERWYQLDSPAFALAAAAWKFKSDKFPRPEVVLIACAEGSNRTDRNFSSQGASSPSLFVHTLPNVRSSSFCQVYSWSGPLYCIQNDPTTVKDAIREATLFYQVTRSKVWVLSVNQKSDAEIEVNLVEIGLKKP